MEHQNKFALFSLAFIPLVMTLGNSMLIPILPTIEKELNLSELQVSMIITLFSVVAIIFIPIAGFISDRYGRKIVIIPSLLIAAIGGAVAGWASSQLEDPFTWILIGRIIQGLGSAGAAPVVLPLIGDMYKDDKQISEGLGVVESFNTFGKVLSPILGSLLAVLVWFMPFFAIPVFSVAAAILVLFFVKVPKQNNTDKRKIKEFVSSVKEIAVREGKWLVAIFMMGIFSMFILFGVLFFLSEQLESEYGMKGVIKGLVLAIPLLSLSIASYITGKKVGDNKRLMKVIIAAGLILVTINLGWIGFSEGIYTLLTGLFLAGLGIGIALPALDAMITEGIEKEECGTVTSIYSSMRYVGVALGPPIVAATLNTGREIIFFGMMGLSVIANIIVFVLIRPEKEEKNELEPAKV
ncbi:MFS transporter [Alkalihalobacillus sp. AL-G]|uniref:MFS transporter n=1 Tax=Alkalihalobacillus sp. AL-G TaxID=2926399 RepID=UPI00272D060F|nr:MFS transporter [Alkalihalobacillus sp. AL-G]WLD91572.1 MFS transporter [Alkalihalobacillus sp. AL-G]